MDCFGDIIKYMNNYDKTIDTIISRYSKSQDKRLKLLITESVNLAALYEINDGLVQNKSWLFPHINRLRVPVVVARDTTEASNYLWAVQEPNSVTQWSLDNKKKRKAKHDFKSKICALINVDSTSFEPIVVYEKGFCQSMSNAVNTKDEELKRQIIENDEIIQSMDGMVDQQNKNHLVIYLITKHINSDDSRIKGVYKLVFDVLLNDIVLVDHQSVVNTFTNWTFCHKTSAVLAVSQSENHLSLFSLNGQTENRRFELTSSSIKSVISVCATAGGSVSVIGRIGNSDFAVELWEPRYGSKLAQLELPYEPIANDSKVIDNNLVITCFKGLILIPILYETVSLSQLIDKVKSNNPIRETQLNPEFTQICDDLSSDNIQSFDEFTRRFEDIVRQRNSLIPEEVILDLLIRSSKISETKRQSLSEFFKILFSLPFNELFMISRIKSLKLNLTEVSSILKLLIDTLSLNNYAIVDWISILIDAHIHLLIVNPNEEVIQLMEAIDLQIDRLGDLCHQLGPSKTLLELILAKKGRNWAAPKRGEYCLELLRF